MKIKKKCCEPTSLIDVPDYIKTEFNFPKKTNQMLVSPKSQRSCNNEQVQITIREHLSHD